MVKKLLMVVVSCVLSAGFLVAAGTVPAGAGVGPGEDRQLTTPTGWWQYTGITAATVNSKVSTNGARLTDVKYEGGGLFTVTMVRDSGPYASGWWWYYGLTAAQVNSYAATNNARVTVVHGYNTSGGIRFAVIMIANTGANYEPWAWYYGTSSYLGTKITSTRRMVSLGRIQGTSYYSAVFGSNAGSDAVGWWWYHGVSGAQITTLLSTNHARLVDLDHNDDSGTYNVIMYKNDGTDFSWWINMSLAGAMAKAAQNDERIIDATPYTVGGNKVFAVVLIDNANALSRKLRSIIRPKIDSGAYGFYLKQVGGPVLASLQHNKQYEPASALKVLYHAKSIHEESLGNTHDTDTVTYHYNNPVDPNDGEICPDNYSSTSTTNLANADTLMMQQSDNRMTRGILEKYGKANVLSYGASLGLTATQINHNIGCPTDQTHNKTTLIDLGKVYEAFQNGTITRDTTWRGKFRSRMLNESNYSGFKNSICPIVQQEATSLGKSASVATSFCNQMQWTAKGGSYQYGGSLPYTVSYDGLALTSVPYKARGVITPQYFIFGEFVDGVHIDSDAEKTAVNAARSKEYQEAMRPFIRAALQSGW